MIERGTKKRSINRLNSMYPLRAKVNESYEKSVRAVKDGKPAVWSMVNIWQSEILLKAMDVEVFHPENYGGAVAATDTAQLYLRRANEEGFPAHLCGYARATLGYTARMMKDLGGEIPPEAPMGGMPKPLLLLGGTTGCDARFKWFEALGRYMDTSHWVLQYPQMGVRQSQAEGAYENAISLIVDELREFVSFMEHLLGRKTDWTVVDEMVSHAAELAHLVHEINELRKARPCPMHSRDYWSVVPACLFLMGDLKDSVEAFRDMYDEVKCRVENGIGAVEEEKYRLMFAELPPWHSLGIFDLLAERGWNFVVESWVYHPTPPVDLDDLSDPLERIARLTYQKNYLPLKRAFENKFHLSYGVQPWLDWARDFECDGAFLHTLLTCRTASCHLRALQHELRNRLHIPSLEVDGDIVDLELFDSAAIVKKAEPFEDVMEHLRAERREEGFAW